jgi:uncharacterized membrane protein
MNGWLANAWGPYVAILAMAVATYLCRAAGVVLMSRIPITPRVERGLRALPGSIVVATVLPVAVQGGLTTSLALFAALGVMSLLRNELAALVCGLGVVSLMRAVGL